MSLRRQLRFAIPRSLRFPLALVLVAMVVGVGGYGHVVGQAYGYDDARHVYDRIEQNSIAPRSVDLKPTETASGSETLASGLLDASEETVFAAKGGLTWAEQSGILRAAARGKGNFGVGSATAREADDLGKAWVGEGYTVASDGKTLVSQSGLRQYRPPSYKPKLGRSQANFEQRFEGQRSNRWQGNAHLDITDLP